MATATSIKLDDALKGRVQHLADARRRTAHWPIDFGNSGYIALYRIDK